MISRSISIAGLLLFVSSCIPTDDNNSLALGLLLLLAARAPLQPSTYSLFVADLDGSNMALIKTGKRQDMTHPRVSTDRKWVSYTTYNDLDANGCGVPTNGYFNTQIRAVSIDGLQDKAIVGPVAGQLSSNNYWIGASNEFTYLSGPASALRLNRATVDANMHLITGPTQIAVAGTITPVDPQTHAATDKIVYSGLYDPGGGFVKSIFIMNLSNSANLVGLSLGRTSAGATIVCADAACTNVMENDPKISPSGDKVAFMRQAAASGATGFGWHIFVVPTATPLSETDISLSSLGSDLLKNEVLPEWVDNDTLIFSTIDIASSTEYTKSVYTMRDNGTQRKKVPLPEGFRYSDVFPFTDADGRKRMIVSAERIGSRCTN